MDNYENENLPLEEETVPQEEVTREEEREFEAVELLEGVALEPEAPKKKKEHKILRRVIAGFLAVVLVAAGCGFTAFFVRSNLRAQDIRNEQLMQQLRQEIEALREQVKENSYVGSGDSVSGTPNTPNTEGLTPAKVYAQNVKSVVAISNQVTTNIYGQISETASSGTGFIISQDGYIVTNYHVIQGATKLTVILYNGQEYEAKLVGGDDANDLAVLKIAASGLQPAVLGKSSELIVGDQVVAIGNPLGELTSTLTVGYVSAMDRSINTDGTLINMIQTDAAINPGNSGGPLFNMKGEVIGITTAKYSGTSASGASIEGIGFAIPMDDVVKKISDLVQYGYITGAQLGVMVHDVDRATAEYYNIPMGAYVKSVVDGGCAAKAGVRAKDIIIALGEYRIGSLNDLTNALQNFKGGETTTITVWRAGGEVELTIRLDPKRPVL